MTRVTNILKRIPLYIWILMFTIIPLLMILVYAVFEFRPDGVHFTLVHLKNAVTEPLYIQSLLRSLKYALISTLVCLALGYPLAYILSRMNDKMRSFLSMLLLLPMWMNFIIRTYAMLSLIDEEGIITKLLGGFMLKGTDSAIIIGMVYNFLPFLVLPIYTSMMKIDKNLIEAAQDLGGNSLHVFTGVVLPLTVPGIVSGITMVFVPCVTTFVIPQLMNNNVWTIGKLIEYKFISNASADGVDPDGGALSFILMILVFISMSIFNLIDKDDESAGGYTL
ncbi:MAG: ABC transporter permease [Clostridia bacterium]|nr:ABC transporter permease [Clostridia bacterium]